MKMRGLYLFTFDGHRRLLHHAVLYSLGFRTIPLLFLSILSNVRYDSTCGWNTESGAGMDSLNT
jgi:hypothetical protein